MQLCESDQEDRAEGFGASLQEALQQQSVGGASSHTLCYQPHQVQRQRR